MVVLAFLTDPGVVRRIPAHLKLPTVVPAVARARSSASPFGFELTEEGFGSSSAEAEIGPNSDGSEPSVQPPP